MTTMYGRKDILSELIGKLDEPHSFTPVYGHEGIGKSTLLRAFYESLLKKEDVVVGYTQPRYSEQPFSNLLVSLLTNLHYRCYEKGGSGRLREIIANLKTALGQLGSDQAVMALFGTAISSLLQTGSKEVARLLEPFAYQGQINFAFSPELSLDRMVPLVRIFSQVIPGYKIVFIIDEIEDDTIWMPENWTMDRLHIYLAQDAEWKTGGGIKLPPLSDSEVETYIKEAAPELLYRYKKEHLARVTEGIPFIIHEIVKTKITTPTEIETISSKLVIKDYSLIKGALADYDQQRQEILLLMAVLKYPLPLENLAQLLNCKQNKLLNFLQEFEDDLFLNRLYLERENFFWFSSQEKQKAVLDFGKESVGLTSFHRKASDYFAGCVTLPTMEEYSSFRPNLAAAAYHYQVAGDKEAAEFYHLALSQRYPWKTLSAHPYLGSLKTPLKIIIYYYLIKTGQADLSIFQSLIQDKEASEELKVEYARVLFYLAIYAGHERKINRLMDIVNLIKKLSSENPHLYKIKVIYVHTLTNASFDLVREKEFKYLQIVITRLTYLAEANKDIEIINILYAKSLAYVSQQLGGVKTMIQTIKDLVEKNPKSVKVRVNYLYALVNLSFDLERKNKVEEIEEVRQEIETLAGKDLNFGEERIALAKIIANASLSLGRSGKFKELEDNLARLAAMSDQKNTWLKGEIMTIYGQTLANAASDFGKTAEFDHLERVIDKIKSLSKENPKLNFIYGQAMANACLDCGNRNKKKARERYQNTLETLTQIIGPSQEELKVLYVKTLVWNIMTLNKQKRIDQILTETDRLNKLLENAESSLEILTILRQTLFNLINYLGGLKQWEYLKKELTGLEKLQGPSGDGKRIYWQALFNTSFFLGQESRFDDMEAYLNILQTIAQREKEAKDICLGALINACFYLGKNGRFAEMNSYLTSLTQAAAQGETEAVRAYSYGLLNASETLGKAGRFEELKEVTQKMSALMSKYHEEELLKIIYAKILVNAYNDFSRSQKLIESNAVINEMEQMSMRYGKVKAFLRKLNFPF